MGLESLMQLYNSIPADWLIAGGIALVAAFDAVRAGTRRVCAFALSLPLALVAFSALSGSYVLGALLQQMSSPFVQPILLAVVLIGAYLIVASIGIEYAGESGQTVQAALAGVALAVIVVTLWNATPALESLWRFSPDVQYFFGPLYRFWWLIGAYVALAYVRR